MRQLMVESGIAPDAILSERKARDTLESVRFRDAILRTAGDVTEVIPCTSRYHVPRCVALLRLLGWKVRTVEMPSDAGAGRRRKLLLYSFKELVALPYDVALLMTGWLVDRIHHSD